MSRTSVWLHENAAFAIVVVIAAVAFVSLAVQPAHWRYGVGILAVALMLAGIFRVVLPEAVQGSLKVRRTRWPDVVIYLGSAALIVVVLAVLRG